MKTPTKTTKRLMRSAFQIFNLFGVFVCVVGREAVKSLDDVAVVLRRVEAGDTALENSLKHNGKSYSFSMVKLVLIYIRMVFQCENKRFILDLQKSLRRYCEC